MTTKQWVYKNPEPEKIQEISKRLQISSTLATLLVNRNITDLKEAELFLRPDLSKLHSPFLLPDMEKAVLRVRKAIDSGEKILVYGDRDVDGVTAIALLVGTLANLGANVDWTVPTEEGYGIQKSTLEKFAQKGARLVITVDCGTSAIEEIAFANTLGMEVIVTDHHLPPETLPNALAIVNPNLKHSRYPMKGLAGCLTAFKFAYALMFTFNRTFNQEYVILDLETTGLQTASDEIVEIGAICIKNFLPVKEFHSLIHPSIPISQEATKVNGITDLMVANAPSLQEILPKLLEFIGNRTIVAHNAKFDLAFLQQAVRKHLHRDFINPFIDTLARSREIFSFESHALEALAKQLRLEMPQAHRSMGDCLATAALFQRIEEYADPRLSFFIEDQLDLVCLGTIADVVPLIGENRTVVKHGLPYLLKTRKIGLQKLLEASALKISQKNTNTQPTAKEIGWNVTPILNAAGRFSKANLTVQLLLTKEPYEANTLVHQLMQLNQDRRHLQKTNIEKFLDLAKTQCDLERDRLIFVVAEALGHGVTGIAANQLMREFGRPVVLLIRDEKEISGSSRSIPGFNIVEAFDECKDLLIRYGGHPAAAGLSVAPDKIECLRKKLKEIAERKITPKFLAPQIIIDMNLPFDVITNEFIQEISQLEPFGEGNPPPLFTLKSAQVEEHSVMGPNKNHLRLKLSNQTKLLSGVGWGMSSSVPTLKKGDLVDLVFYLERDTWNDLSPKLVLQDLQVAKPSQIYSHLN